MIQIPQSQIPLYAGLPFILLLLLIAVMPLAFPKFWEKNKHKAFITTIVSLPVLVFLLVRFPAELAASLEDYFSFIMLLAALYIISGGIHVSADLRATPRVNTVFLIVGALAANLIGTTGASMLLIRPLLRTNKERKNTGHIPVFFIFLVSNIGGLLTPLADPPLFMGYLRGVPFSWTFSLFPEWLAAVALIIAVFYVFDTIQFNKERPEDIALDNASVSPLRITGIVNLVFLAGVVCAVAIHITSPYREGVMALMAVLSLVATKKETHASNSFTYAPIIEVAVLFAGIFVTMVPLLVLLREHGAQMGITKPWQFFWISGGLSSVLDNTPTYVTFFSLAESVTKGLGLCGTAVAGVQEVLLRAISCGAVFMGANTYIGNGPNFMVKCIAEEQKFPIPHFFAYMGYAAAILMPIFLVITFLFFL